MSAELWIAALGYSLVSAGLAYAGAGILSRPNADGLWRLASLGALSPVLAAWLGPTLAPALAGGFDPAWLTGLGGAPGASSAVPAEAGAPAPEPFPWITALMALWLGGVALRLGYEHWRHARLNLTLRGGLAEPAGLKTRLVQAARRQGLARIPRLTVLEGAAAPFAYGVARPGLAIGSDWLAPGKDIALDCVLAHELSHIRRRDPLWEAGFAMAGLLLWFNPFWFAIQRRRRAALEAACDAQALNVLTPVSARTYARALLDAARMRSGRAPAIGFGVSDKRSLELRLTSLLNPAPNRSRLSAALAALAIAGLAAPAALAQTYLAIAAQAPAFTHAVLEGRITAPFGRIKTDGDRMRDHHGYDIAAPEGAPVSAPADGVVVHAETGWNRSERYGEVLAIEHGEGWVTLYAHLQGFAVKVGDRVKAGQTIAYVGNTGASTGPHLHVELRQYGERTDPAEKIPGLAP